MPSFHLRAAKRRPGRSAAVAEGASRSGTGAGFIGAGTGASNNAPLGALTSTPGR